MKINRLIQDGKRHFWGGLPIKTEDKGVGLMKQLFARAKELGIDIWYESRACEINQRERPNYRYCCGKRQANTITVNTASVILACGSFEANKKMRSEHIGEEWEAAIVRGTEFNTGDGISWL